jgi:hypothetical protein
LSRSRQRHSPAARPSSTGRARHPDVSEHGHGSRLSLAVRPRGHARRARGRLAVVAGSQMPIPVAELESAVAAVEAAEGTGGHAAQNRTYVQCSMWTDEEARHRACWSAS